MYKTISVTFAIVLAALLAGVGACGPGGVSEGGECGGKQDDCGTNLVCQPVSGRTNHSYCCPTPAEASNYQVCHPLTPQGDQTPR